MLDIGFSELVVIGVVALIVIGPERLPRVARTAGHLLGRFQRYVADVKADINREMDLAELKKLLTSVEEAARSVEQSVRTGVEGAEKEFKDAQSALESTGTELKEAVSSIQMPHMGMGAASAVQQSVQGADGGAPSSSDAPAALISATADPRPVAEPVPAANEAANADDEGPSPQLELGLDPGAQPAAQKQA
jgi:sec-independent protein translocase protein TatB